MCFVSDIVFSSRQSPEGGIIEWVLNCIAFGTADTKEFSLFRSVNVVDPTPVLRSYLLKLLLQCNQSDFVNKELDYLMSNWTADKTYQLQTMVLLMDCCKVCTFCFRVGSIVRLGHWDLAIFRPRWLNAFIRDEKFSNKFSNNFWYCVVLERLT